MSLITFFQENIKPFKLRGTGIIHVLNTTKYDNNLSSIKQNDVNIWIYEKSGTVLSIDAGYKNDTTLSSSFKKINVINENIEAVFITHADIDHVGGLLSDNRFAPNADVYLHKAEESMLLGKEKRFSFAGIKLKNPIKYDGSYNLFQDRDIIYINNIKIECFHIPGHTRGHSAFLIDNLYLFTGDSIATRDDGGYCFFDFYNMNSHENIKSLKKLKNLLSNNKDILVCTSHNGIQPIEKAFLHITEIAKGSKKTPFDKAAPFDSFK